MVGADQTAGLAGSHQPDKIGSLVRSYQVQVGLAGSHQPDSCCCLSGCYQTRVVGANQTADFAWFATTSRAW